MGFPKKSFGNRKTFSQNRTSFGGPPKLLAARWERVWATPAHRSCTGSVSGPFWRRPWRFLRGGVQMAQLRVLWRPRTARRGAQPRSGAVHAGAAPKGARWRAFAGAHASLRLSRPDQLQRPVQTRAHGAASCPLSGRVKVLGEKFQGNPRGSPIPKPVP